MANMDGDLQNHEEPEELEDAPLGFDPAQAESICFRCGGNVLDLGIEKPDKYRPERRCSLIPYVTSLNLPMVLVT